MLFRGLFALSRGSAYHVVQYRGCVRKACGYLLSIKLIIIHYHDLLQLIILRCIHTTNSNVFISHPPLSQQVPLIRRVHIWISQEDTHLRIPSIDTKPVFLGTSVAGQVFTMIHCMYDVSKGRCKPLQFLSFHQNLLIKSFTVCLSKLLQIV